MVSYKPFFDFKQVVMQLIKYSTLLGLILFTVIVNVVIDFDNKGRYVTFHGFCEDIENLLKSWFYFFTDIEIRIAFYLKKTSFSIFRHPFGCFRTFHRSFSPLNSLFKVKCR